MNYRATLFDLDGTLAESKQPLAPEMAEKFAELLAVMPGALVSGANFSRQLEQFVAHLPAGANLSNLYLFPENAAECQMWDGRAWKQMYSYSLTEDQKKMILAALGSVLEETGIIEGAPSWGERIEDRGEQITFSALGQHAPVSEKAKWDPDQAKRKDLAERLAKLIPAFNISIGGMTSIDITKKGVNKTQAVKWLSKHLEIPISEMAYIGDSLFEGGNDAIVKETGVPTIETSGPKQTLQIIDSLLSR